MNPEAAAKSAVASAVVEKVTKSFDRAKNLGKFLHAPKPAASLGDLVKGLRKRGALRAARLPKE